jgi:dipeptidyl aminopeptidase/acylaminoacyl peptidase
MNKYLIALLLILFTGINSWSIKAETTGTEQTLNIEDFAALPNTSRSALSPNGEKLASITRVADKHGKGSAVELMTLANSKTKVLLFSDNSKYFIHNLTWKDNKTLLVTSYYPSERDTNPFGGGQIKFKTRELRLFIINTETGKINSPFSRSFLNKFMILPNNLASIVDVLPEDPDHILMALPITKPRTKTEYRSEVVYQVNINTQAKKIVQKAKQSINRWQTDRQHRIRVGQSFDDGIVTTHVKDFKTGTWQELWPYKVFSEQEVQIKGFGHDPNELYISAYHNKRKAIFKVDLSDPTLTRELVHASDEFDINGYLYYSDSQKKVLGISSYEEGGTVFFDEELNNVQKVIDKSLPHSANYLYSLSDNMNKFLVYSTGATESGTYYLGQRKPLKIQSIKYRYNQLPPNKLVAVKEYNYNARDGLAIQGQLTLPNVNIKKNLPTIIFPHGGPQARDDKAFDYWVQFFANKGYAVLQMNFRGSDGQGIALRDAGLKRWGKEMQDDIEDGAQQLIADGITDANKICIVGASYGGYAALMGVVKTPDFYQCAISIAGVSSVFDLVRDNRNFFEGYNVVEEQIGKLDAELYKVSPVNRADEIKVPVLLVHGDSDIQVDVKHSRNMHEKLQQAGKNVTYLELANEDHYLANENNRIATFKAMNDFLDTNLPINAISQD